MILPTTFPFANPNMTDLRNENVYDKREINIIDFLAESDLN